MAFRYRRHKGERAPRDTREKPWRLRQGREPNPRTCELRGLSWFRACGREGGLARAAKLSPERRRQIARHAVQVRWARVRAAQAANSPSAH